MELKTSDVTQTISLESLDIFGQNIVHWIIFIRHDKYKVGNKYKNKLKSAKRLRNNHRQCSTDKS